MLTCPDCGASENSNGLLVHSLGCPQTPVGNELDIFYNQEEPDPEWEEEDDTGEEEW